ncbi:restriction endonuclease subunit S [Pseudarthrobacter sulfonivorans]|uniref:restriction endonuclease subunit S n=1 Tax=Pseudarthrobacter sulfonivorans TaxID=121292 RepID=UPI0028656FA0|nr:restriction endonuclease subunit S [Pseudarthrobacter sulfonivorans]MDR6413468.1 type I restriction enzyme S subunit [Pseudarthrobacter sulfonivorans]
MTAFPTATVRSLSEVVTKGTTPTSLGRAFVSSGVRFIKVETIATNGTYLPDKVAHIDADTHNLLGRSQLRQDDILFSIAGALGRTTIVDKSWLPANTNQAFAIIRPCKRSGIDSRYLLWALRSQAIGRHISEINVQAAQANLSLEQVRSFEIPVPEMDTQKLISKALDDADNLITTLERLIGKKHAIKQGMMQLLLTGKTRLPGYTEPWTKQRLGALGTLLKGRGVRRDDVRASGIPCIRYGEIYTVFNDYTRSAKSFVSPEIASTALPIKTGDLLFAGSGETRDEIGKCVAYIGPIPAVAGGDIVVLRGDVFNSVYLGLLANTSVVVDQKSRAGQGDAVVHISSQALADIEVELPPRNEQDAIAEVVVDVDREIRLLRGRLTKAKAMKQGMMQDLLTGHTRLAVADVDA